MLKSTLKSTLVYVSVLDCKLSSLLSCYAYFSAGPVLSMVICISVDGTDWQPLILIQLAKSTVVQALTLSCFSLKICYKPLYLTSHLAKKDLLSDQNSCFTVQNCQQKFHNLYSS